MSQRMNSGNPQLRSMNQQQPVPMGGFSAVPVSRSSGGGADSNQTMNQLRAYTSKVEDAMDTFSQPLKPYLPAMGRFLIVVTFLEDALRIVTQWGDQTWYLEKHRSFPWGLSHLFLLINISTMLSCSSLVIYKRYTEYAVAGLFAVVISQGFGYGLIFDLNFFLRNLSVVGGLLMVLSDYFGRQKAIFAGLPSMTETDRRQYFQLAGRILLVFLFIGFVFQGERSSWGFWRVLISLIGFAACIMVVVGFKAKWTASFLILLLSVFNVFMNNWWSIHSTHPQRDFLKYDFFQTLSIVGGLLLLVNQGAGGISVDEKKKIY